MHITLYFDDAPLHIYSKDDLASFSLNRNIYIDPDNDTIVLLIHQLKQKELNEVTVIATNFEQTKQMIFSTFNIIEAAGGIVENEKNELLFIFRRGKWDLPKGKIEPQESPEIAAAREIEEETGIKGMVLQSRISETYHYYSGWGKENLKISHWYYFQCNSNVTISPQLEEDIVEVKWINRKQLEFPLSNTYATIKLLVESFIKNSE